MPLRPTYIPEFAGSIRPGGLGALILAGGAGVVNARYAAAGMARGGPNLLPYTGNPSSGIYYGPNSPEIRASNRRGRKIAHKKKKKKNQAPPPVPFIPPSQLNVRRQPNMAFGFSMNGNTAAWPFDGTGGGGGQGFDWGSVLGAGIGAVGNFLTAKEQAKAARDMAKAAQGMTSQIPGYGAPFVQQPRQAGPYAGGYVAPTPAMAGPFTIPLPGPNNDLRSRGGCGGYSAGPRIRTEQRQLPSGRVTTDTWVRAPKETGTLRVVRSRRRCSKR